MGFKANLTADMIVEQILYYQRQLQRQGQKVSNVVFMGMGEPMLNLAQVQEAISIITDKQKLAMSPRRITVSTSGYIPQLKQLIGSGFAGRLAISLHAPTQELREQLMPTVARNNPLPALIKLLDDYALHTNSRVSYEYILISGVNDQHQHSQELISLLGGRLAHVNLIPYNPVPNMQYAKPSRNHVHLFMRWLEKGGIPVSIRSSMGDEVSGACGQLAGTLL
jgi:23S rRNA (adenine2503-C2)-methyltransferase